MTIYKDSHTAHSGSNVGHLSQRDFTGVPGNVDERVAMPAAEAQEEDSALVNLRFSCAEHDPKATASASPHGGSPDEGGNGTAETRDYTIQHAAAHLEDAAMAASCRPSKEWYAAKIQETLGDEFVVGTQASSAPSECAAFEAWFCKDGDYEPEWLEKSGANHALYMDADTENMWQAWQARAALAQPTPVQEAAATPAMPRGDLSKVWQAADDVCEWLNYEVSERSPGLLKSVETLNVEMFRAEIRASRAALDASRAVATQEAKA